MFIQHNELIDDSKLPPNSYYQEPRDNHIIHVANGDSYNSFSEKVVKYRESQKYPKLNPTELRLLVISSIERSVPSSELTKYFKLQAVLPQFSQIAAFAKAIVSQVGQGALPYNQRDSRAAKCVACKIHKPHNSVPLQSPMMALSAVVTDNSHESLQDLQISPNERKLGQCGMCGCNLSSKVRYALIGIVQGLNPPQLDTIFKIYGPMAFDSCWILNEAISDRNIKPMLEKKLSQTQTQGMSLLTAYLLEKSTKARNT
jgi:hypothetical protein